MAEITPERIENALNIAAQHAVMNEQTLPVFLRLEKELEKARNTQSNPLARAKQIAAQANSAA